jgi:hypothetical protein
MGGILKNGSSRLLYQFLERRAQGLGGSAGRTRVRRQANIGKLSLWWTARMNDRLQNARGILLDLDSESAPSEWAFH